MKSQVSSVSAVTGLRAGRPGLDFRHDMGFFRSPPPRVQTDSGAQRGNRYQCCFPDSEASGSWNWRPLISI